MVQLWSCTLLVLASLCVVHTKPYHEEKHRALIRTGYVHFPGDGYYRLSYQNPVIWAEARRNCQQEGATLAVVNSEREAENLRSLVLNYGLANIQRDWRDVETTTWDDSTTEETPTTTWDDSTTGETPTTTWITTETTTDGTTPAPDNAIIHIGFHDLFIEGEYLTIHNEPIIMAGFIRWKVGYPNGDEEHNCGGFDIEKFLLDNPCDVKLPYICEIFEAH